MFTDLAWEDYLYWEQADKKVFRRINQLIRDIDRNGHAGLGKPEPLRHELQGLLGAAESILSTGWFTLIRDNEIASCNACYHYEK